MVDRARFVVWAASNSGARAIGVLAVAVALGAAAEVRAQGDSPIDRPRVTIEIDEACELDRAPLERVLEVELGSDTDLSASPDEATSHVGVHCEGTFVRIEVDDALTQKALQRRLDLTGASPDARARLVALGIAELLAAAWIELGMEHDEELAEIRPPTASSEERRAIALELAHARLTQPEPPTEPPPPEPERARPIGVRAIAVGSLSGGQPAHFAIGGGLAMDAELLAPLAILVDVRAEHTGGAVRDVGSYTATAAWAGALLALRLPLGVHHADFGLGARAGVGWIEGSSTSGLRTATQIGPLVSAIGAVHLSLHIGHAAYLHLGLELGWVLVSIYGTLAPGGDVVAQIGGGQAAITLGFEVRPE